MRFDRSVNGNLDEMTTFFDEPVPTEPNAELWLDLSKVEMVNSSGIRSWMKWCKSLPPTLKVFLTHCPWNFVVQASIIPDFFPKQCRLQSIHAFYFCDQDSHGQNVELKREQNYFYADDTKPGAASIQLPKVLCEKCSQPMEPDFVESRLFAFLKQA